MRESDIEKQVNDFARANGIRSLKLAGPNQKGQPDRAYFYKGKTVFIEFKAPGGRPTALQLKWLENFRELGFFASWTANPELAISWLKEHLLK